MSIIRDNTYYEKRLKKEGQTDLLARVTSGEISMYRAAILAGHRKKTPRDNAEALSRRWYRLSKKERLMFVHEHYSEIVELLLKRREVITKQAKEKAGK
jgi:hypothetical protein